MKAIITVEKEVDIRTLSVDAGVRYWEDTTINGVEDTEEGQNIPCKNGDRWQPVIDLASGRIKNWEKGKTAEVHYKICDDGNYYLLGPLNEPILSIERDYVPKILSPKEDGCGDYIIMDIDKDGNILDWVVDISDFPGLSESKEGER